MRNYAKNWMRLILGASVIASVASCSSLTPVRVINYDDTEYFETEKGGEKFVCMSDYYLKEIERIKITKTNPPKP